MAAPKPWQVTELGHLGVKCLLFGCALPKKSRGSKKWWREDYFPFVLFSRAMLGFGRASCLEMWILEFISRIHCCRLWGKVCGLKSTEYFKKKSSCSKNGDISASNAQSSLATYMHQQFHPLSWDFSMARNMQVIIGGSTVHSIRLLTIYHPNVEKSASIQFTQKRHAIVCTHKEKTQ